MRTRRLSMQQIKSFRAVMLAGTVSAAARELNISQPSLTRLLRRTADIAGFPLFETIRNRLVPTPEAHVMMRHLGYLDEQLDSLDDAIQRLREAGTGSFRLGATASLSRALIPAALARFRRSAPLPHLHFDTVQMQSAIDYLLLGRGECFVSVIPLTHAAIDRRAVRQARLVCVVPMGHHFSGAQALSPRELVGEELVLTDPSRWYGQTIGKLLAKAGVVLRPTITVRVAQSALGLVRNGLGIAVVDEFAAMGADREGMAAIPLDLPAFSSLFVHRSKDMPRSRNGAEFESNLGVVCAAASCTI